jgi:hypothetical protein
MEGSYTQLQGKGLLSESQFGSCKAMSSQTPVFLEILQHDLSRMTRKQYGQINYNAKACYDCILPNLASLISQRFGVHDNVVRLHHHLLKNMQYHVVIPKSQQKATGCKMTWGMHKCRPIAIYHPRLDSTD